MKKPNSEYKADVVATGVIAGWVIWVNDSVVANVNRDGYDLIAAGTAAMKKSFYDEDAALFLSGTVDQLVGAN